MSSGQSISLATGASASHTAPREVVGYGSFEPIELVLVRLEECSNWGVVAEVSVWSLEGKCLRDPFRHNL